MLRTLRAKVPGPGPDPGRILTSEIPAVGELVASGALSAVEGAVGPLA